MSNKIQFQLVSVRSNLFQSVSLVAWAPKQVSDTRVQGTYQICSQGGNIAISCRWRSSRARSQWKNQKNQKSFPSMPGFSSKLRSSTLSGKPPSPRALPDGERAP